MTQYVQENEFAGWRCAECDCELEIKQIFIDYLGHAFPTDLPVCPKCGQVFLPEELVLNKMYDIEQQMEEK